MSIAGLPWRATRTGVKIRAWRCSQKERRRPTSPWSRARADTVSLKDLRGKTVVLYFYPKDDTPGCTREACAFRDTQALLKKKGAVVLGVSGDSREPATTSSRRSTSSTSPPVRPRQGGGQEIRGLGREGPLRQEDGGHDPLHLRDRRRRGRAQGLPAGAGWTATPSRCCACSTSSEAPPKAMRLLAAADFAALEATLRARREQVDEALRLLAVAGQAPSVPGGARGQPATRPASACAPSSPCSWPRSCAAIPRASCPRPAPSRWCTRRA